MKYRLEVTKEQLQIMHNAIEEYFRLRLGQFNDLATDLSFINFNYKEHTDEDFTHRIEARDNLQDYCEHWFRYNFPASNRSTLKTDAINNSIDMWHVIEHQQWLDNPYKDTMGYHRASGPVFQTGEEELMKIERIDR